jgi:hypothetical protein
VRSQSGAAVNKAYLILCDKCGHARFQHRGAQCLGKCRAALDISVTTGAKRHCACPRFIAPKAQTTIQPRSIIFGAYKIRRLLARATTQTRRICKENEPDSKAEWKECLCREIDPMDAPCMICDARFGIGLYGRPGGLLWVKERWAVRADQDRLPPSQLDPKRDKPWFYADSWPRPEEPSGCAGGLGRWRSPIHMPKWASRIWLEITAMRYERIQSITEADALAEGVEGPGPGATTDDNGKIVLGYSAFNVGTFRTAREAFSLGWRAINGDRAWEDNPWVRVITFKEAQPPRAA